MSYGIYKLTFTGTDKVYIGQSKDIEKRFREHLASFRQSTASIKMMQAFNSYGVPLLEILCYCTEEDICSLEEKYISLYNSVAYGFNTMSSSGTSPKVYGETCGSSVYTNNQITTVFHLLLDIDNTVEGIAETTGVSISAIAQVSSGVGHRWLLDKYPEDYAKLLNISGNRRVLRAKDIKVPSTTKKYAPEQYLQVLLLATLNKTAKEIHSMTEVSIDVIRDITSCRRHKWLEKADPANYAKLKQIKGK